MTTLLVTLAGGAGAGLRVWLDVLLRRLHRPGLPVATLLVNLVGSLALGLFAARAVAAPADASAWLDVGGAGFCGGFTTFSAVGLELGGLVARRAWPVALLLATTSTVITVAAAWVGLELG